MTQDDTKTNIDNLVILHYLNLTSNDKFSQKILWLSFLLDLEVLVERAKNHYPNCKIQSRYYSFYLLSPNRKAEKMKAENF